MSFWEMSFFYSEVIEAKTYEDFLHDIVHPMEVLEELNGEDVMDERKKTHTDPPHPTAVFDGMYVACAYALQAKKAVDRAERELAWSYLADARFWCGTLVAARSVKTVAPSLIVQSRKLNGAKGGFKNGGNKKMALVKAEAHRLAIEMKPPLNGWKSKHHAATTIKSKVIDFSKSIDSEMSAERAVKTITEWLSAMPNRAQLFPS